MKMLSWITPYLHPRRSRAGGNPVKYVNPQGFSTCNTTQRGSCAVSLALLLISAIALTACGGGSSLTSGSNSLSAAQRIARGIGGASLHENRGQGSVTQSSEKGDVVNFDVTYVNSKLSISGTKTNSDAGTSVAISSVDVRVLSTDEDEAEGVLDFYDSSRRILVKTGTDYYSGGHGTESNYLIFGIWVVSPDNSLSTGQFEYAVFADGSNPFEQNSIRALTGTARYEGTAQGIFTGPIDADAIDDAERGRASYANIDPITREYIIESDRRGFDAKVVLTADFDDGIDGKISGILSDFTFEDSEGTLAVFGESTTTINLPEVAIGDDHSGYFTKEEADYTTELENDEYFQAKGDYKVSWGGQFYGDPASSATGTAAHPGSVAGTFSGITEEKDKSFIGVFSAYK